MTIFPISLNEIFLPIGVYAVFLVIGFAFGYVLEIAGFGNSRLLAAQFYFKNLTVLKVMFTAIIVAMVGIFLTTAVGLLDYNLIWVNPTYLWPGIIGGLIMGVGFIVGGFCPGTSLVAAATLKVDGFFFVAGVLTGIVAFGESVSLFTDFFYSSYMGRFTLMDLFNTSTGVVVVGVVLMALFMFWGGEKLEQIIGKQDSKLWPRWRYGAALGLVAIAAVVLVIGQPTNEDRWNTISVEKQPRLDGRTVQIHPGELLSLRDDSKIKLVMLDVRKEADYNVFHLLDANHTPLDNILAYVPDLILEPANTVFVVMSNDEAGATEAWKTLVAEGVPNVYILEGGINNWLSIFGHEEFASSGQLSALSDDTLHYDFPAAVGARHPAADPEADHYNLIFVPKVELELKRAPSGGGCG
ncbi:MAG: sulfurtransferase [Chloroflexi bacterium]|nr:MAG: sulfurtransferase [Chloroflexota bacterium]MBL1192990.1 sulfurtransferase [Chloroflexota bacterium]NOH10283.1 YeeE/YedE family protein [Chloroflexota bacterium]